MGAKPAADLCRPALQRVLDSEAFRNADSLRRLLAYMAERTLKGGADDLKEYTIGIDVFGKPSSYDPQKDASVRVQIGRLRQKLEEYYQAEGAGETHRIVLPKGHFTILFEARELAAPAPPVATARKWASAHAGFRVAVGLLGASLLLSGILWYRLDRLASRVAPVSSSADFAPVWTPFLNPDIPGIVIFGSPPFFASTSHRLFLRMYRPLNPEDPRSSPDFREIDTALGPLQGPRYDYASMGDAIGVQRLTAFLASHGAAPRALPAHLAVWDTIQDANLIFVGAARMNPMLRRLPIQQDFELGPDDNIHNRNPRPGELPVYETTSHRDALTYAIVGLWGGLKPGRDILIVEGHSTPGTEGAVDFLTSSEGMHLIRDKLALRPGDRRRFQILLRIFTDNDAPVKTEYVTHHVAP